MSAYLQYLMHKHISLSKANIHNRAERKNIQVKLAMLLPNVKPITLLRNSQQRISIRRFQCPL